MGHWPCIGALGHWGNEQCMAHMPMTNSTLKTAEPTMVPKPTAEPVKVPTNEVASSGIEPPAAMKVAPATSSERLSFSQMISSVGTKYSSHTMASATNMYAMSSTWTRMPPARSWARFMPSVATLKVCSAFVSTRW